MEEKNSDYSGTKITEISEEITEPDEEYEDSEEPLEIYHPADNPEEPFVKVVLENNYDQNISEPIENILENDSTTEEEPFIDDIFDNNVNTENSVENEENILDDDILTDEDLDYIDENIEDSVSDEDILPDEYEGSEELPSEESTPVVPIYPAQDDEAEVLDEEIDYKQGDIVNHPRYGQGTVEKIIKYGNKTLCSIYFENVGRRLLDPSISEFEKV